MNTQQTEHEIEWRERKRAVMEKRIYRADLNPSKVNVSLAADARRFLKLLDQADDGDTIRAQYEERITMAVKVIDHEMRKGRVMPSSCRAVIRILEGEDNLTDIEETKGGRADD